MTAITTDRPHVGEREAADYLRVSIATLRRWRWLRIGPAWCRPAGSKAPLYLRADLDAWIESGRVEPRSAA